jgi:hypothetical protein
MFSTAGPRGEARKEDRDKKPATAPESGDKWTRRK